MAENNKKSETSKKATGGKTATVTKSSKTGAKEPKTKGRGRPKMTEAQKAEAKAKREANKKAGYQRAPKKSNGTEILTLNKISKLVAGKGTAKIEVSKSWVKYQEAISKNPELLEAIQKYS